MPPRWKSGSSASSHRPGNTGSPCNRRHCQPTHCRLRSKFPTGSTVVVKFSKEGTVYGFYADILQVHFDPAPIIYLKHPKELESFEFRGCTRFLCNIPAHMHNRKAHYYCMIKDISSGGCHLMVHQCSLKNDEHIQVKETTSLVLNLCGFGEITLDCTVKNLQRSGEFLSYGLQFKQDGASYTKIVKYFEMLMD